MERISSWTSRLNRWIRPVQISIWHDFHSTTRKWEENQDDLHVKKYGTHCAAYIAENVQFATILLLGTSISFDLTPFFCLTLPSLSVCHHSFALLIPSLSIWHHSFALLYHLFKFAMNLLICHHSFTLLYHLFQFATKFILLWSTFSQFTTISFNLPPFFHFALASLSFRYYTWIML